MALYRLPLEIILPSPTSPLVKLGKSSFHCLQYKSHLDVLAQQWVPCRVPLLIMWIAGWHWVSTLSLTSTLLLHVLSKSFGLAFPPSLWLSPRELASSAAVGWYASPTRQPSWLKDSNTSAPYGLFLPLSYSFDFSLQCTFSQEVQGQLKGNICQGLSLWKVD